MLIINTQIGAVSTAAWNERLLPRRFSDRCLSHDPLEEYVKTSNLTSNRGKALNHDVDQWLDVLSLCVDHQLMNHRCHGWLRRVS